MLNLFSLDRMFDADFCDVSRVKAYGCLHLCISMEKVAYLVLAFPGNLSVCIDYLAAAVVVFNVSSSLCLK